MLAVLSGGGTAGHINPALALAEVLQEQGHEVRFAGTPNGVEARLVPAAGVPFKAFEASGFDRSRPWTLVTGVLTIQKSTKLAKKWLKEIGADVVVGFGGYVSIPVARAAEQLGIPVVVHEQNSVMGMANKQLSKKAFATCLTYEVASQGTSCNNPVVTGNPVRSSVLSSTREEGRAMLGFPEDDLMLLVFGGSLGARHINQALCSMKERLLAVPNLRVVHITGPKELERVEQELALTDQERERWMVMGYQDRMGETMAAADCIVSRAGATSLAEISARAIPAVLVPFPFATADHQTTNAQAYVAAGCASMIADDQVESAEFAELVMRLIQDADLRESMRQAARAQKTADAGRRLADVVLQAAASRN
ncbi:MAG: undecaprenyldiphospho-muramoylpentapeptide beta-N-acetylglucosaminyltransferase [Coriobacteriia bacterium]|nr:undecaprenyldiphospho-muramoylpentapeptide beta-N-acetylglucosaminyltransferase [Coriobacteriia bacterium]